MASQRGILCRPLLVVFNLVWALYFPVLKEWLDTQERGRFVVFVSLFALPPIETFTEIHVYIFL